MPIAISASVAMCLAVATPPNAMVSANRSLPQRRLPEDRLAGRNHHAAPGDALVIAGDRLDARLEPGLLLMWGFLGLSRPRAELLRVRQQLFPGIHAFPRELLAAEVPVIADVLPDKSDCLQIQVTSTMPLRRQIEMT